MPVGSAFVSLANKPLCQHLMVRGQVTLLISEQAQNFREQLIPGTLQII